MFCFATLAIMAFSFVDCQFNQARFLDYRNHECSRRCVLNELPRTCEYIFTLESYHTLSKACHNCPFNTSDCYRPHCVPGDGRKRSLLVVNRMLPGPTIRVCKGDTISVIVDNQMEFQGVETTIHWHGIHQRGTPWYDGVPQLTQCSIQSKTSFRYQFLAYPAGTHYWHSHVGMQRGEGLAGPIVILDPEDPNASQYDYDLPEHVVFFQNWEAGLTSLEYVSITHSTVGVEPHSLIVNGMARNIPHVRGDSTQEYFTPKPIFFVARGQRYRFRLISNVIGPCNVVVSVDNHTLTAIASDGQPVEPLEVDALTITPGEIFDVVLHANRNLGSSYYMRFMADGPCTRWSTHLNAVVRYAGSPDVEPEGLDDYASGNRGGRRLNPTNANLGPDTFPVNYLTSSFPDSYVDEAEVEITTRHSLENTIFDLWRDSGEQNRIQYNNNRWNKPEADSKHYISFDFYREIANPLYNHPVFYPNIAPELTTLVNLIALEMPPSPLLTQFTDVPQDWLCNETMLNSKGIYCNETVCSCTHVIKLDLNEVAEMFLIDRGTVFAASHPWHMHGNLFRVIGYDRINPDGVTVDDIKMLDSRGEIRRKLDRAPLKDTVAVPDGGYTLIRLHATNPGFWMFHCHINDHLQLGMGLIVQVGEPSDMPKSPTHFPTCGNWYMNDYVGRNERCDARQNVCSVLLVVLMVMVLMTKRF